MLFGRLVRWLDRGPAFRDPRHGLGRQGERLAEQHLRKKGLAIVARNWRCHLGEIDLVARDGDVLVFVEVKTRSDLGSDPEERVNEAKRRQIRKVAGAYVARVFEEPLIRFDVVAVVLLPGEKPVVRHHEDDFV